MTILVSGGHTLPFTAENGIRKVTFSLRCSSHNIKLTILQHAGQWHLGHSQSV